MKIIQLRYFKAVATYLNFTKAAEKCFVSQPAISAAIKDLEEEYDVQLFHRDNNKLILTEEGEVFLSRCNYLLDYVDKTEVIMKDMGKKYNLIKIGIPPMIGTFIFPSIYKAFMQKYPNVEIELFEAGSVSVRKAVEMNAIDLGIAILNEVPLEKFNYLKTTETELHFFVSKNHPLAKKEVITLKDLNNEKIILLKSDSYQNMKVKERFKQNNIELNVMLYTSQINMIVEMLSYGNVGAFLFKEIGNYYNDLVSIPLDEPIKIEIGLLWNKNQLLFAVKKKFIDFVREKMSDL
jgi:DNA-binding transcriptional LysR family regulator